jgi:hypothetical protein
VLPPQGTTCVASHDCTVSLLGGGGSIFFKGLGFVLWVPSVNAAPSTPNRLDVYRK